MWPMLYLRRWRSISGVLCQLVLRTVRISYIPQLLWGVITCPCLRRCRSISAVLCQKQVSRTGTNWCHFPPKPTWSCFDTYLCPNFNSNMGNFRRWNRTQMQITISWCSFIRWRTFVLNLILITHTFVRMGSIEPVVSVEWHVFSICCINKMVTLPCDFHELCSKNPL